MIRRNKNIITAETVKKDLTGLLKTDIYADIVSTLAYLLVFVPFVILGFFVAKHNIVMAVIFFLFVSFFAALFFYKLISDVVKLYRVRRGGFSVMKDTVSLLARGELISRNKTADVIYFTDHGRYVPSQTVFDLCSLGDEFYLAVPDTKKKEVLLVYHSKMYEYKSGG